MDILLVEDETIIALEMAMILESAGETIVGQATTSDQAIALAGRTRPRLALMDVRLANHTSGVEAALEIHRRFGTPSIMVTSFCQEARRASDAAIGCLEKPFERNELLQAVAFVRDVLDRKVRHGAPRRFELYRALGDDR